MKVTRREALLTGAALGTVGGGYFFATSPRFRDDGGRSPATRERLEQVTRRTTRLVDASLEAPVDLEYVPLRTTPNASTSWDRIVDAAQHVDSFDVPGADPGSLGRYDAQNRTIEIAALDAVPDHVDVDRYLDVPLSEFRATHPSDPLLAHELTHALQFDTVDQRSGPRDFSLDARAANAAIVEGAATYVESACHQRCLDGRFEPCVTPAATPSLGEMPLWRLAHGTIPYVNGAQFVQWVLADRGWTGVWDLLREAPATSGAVMHPDRYPDGEPPDPAVEDRSRSEWLETERDRLGVNALYVKLMALDRTDPVTAPPITADTPTTTARYGPGGFRADVLREWVTDRCIGYVDVDDTDRIGYRWVTEWSSTRAAERIAETVAAGYDDLAERSGSGWQLHGRYHTLDREGTTVTFGMGPDRAAIERIVGGDRT